MSLHTGDAKWSGRWRFRSASHSKSDQRGGLTVVPGKAQMQPAHRSWAVSKRKGCAHA